VPYKNPEDQRRYALEWLKRNPEKAREAMRQWRERNPDLRRERNRAYKRAAYLRRGPEIDALKAEYLASHPEVRRAKDHGYRARKAAAGGSFTGKEWLELVATYAGLCGYCGRAARLEPEHRTPLSRGGDNSISNIIPSCRNCNAKKATRTEAEYRMFLASELPDDLQSTS
jgi:5-methylcytosine-specific restriction endonuclease McrA